MFSLLLVFLFLFELSDKFKVCLSKFYTKNSGAKSLSRKISDARFASGLSLGIHSGLPIGEAAQLAAELAAGNPKAQSSYEKCCELLSEGNSLSFALGASSALPPKHRPMLAAADKSGFSNSGVEAPARRLQAELPTKNALTRSKLVPAIDIRAPLSIMLLHLSSMLPPPPLLPVLA